MRRRSGQRRLCCWVTLDNDDKANALSPSVIEEITALYESDLRAEGMRAVLLRSVGKNFSAGADLDHLKSLRDAGPDENRATQKPCVASSPRCSGSPRSPSPWCRAPASPEAAVSPPPTTTWSPPPAPASSTAR